MRPTHLGAAREQSRCSGAGRLRFQPCTANGHPWRRHASCTRKPGNCRIFKMQVSWPTSQRRPRLRRYRAEAPCDDFRRSVWIAQIGHPRSYATDTDDISRTTLETLDSQVPSSENVFGLARVRVMKLALSDSARGEHGLNSRICSLRSKPAHPLLHATHTVQNTPSYCYIRTCSADSRKAKQLNMVGRKGLEVVP